MGRTREQELERYHRRKERERAEYREHIANVIAGRYVVGTPFLWDQRAAERKEIARKRIELAEKHRTERAALAERQAAERAALTPRAPR
jgi:hypothetical protein